MFQLSDYDGKNVRAVLKSGEVFEGEAVYDHEAYCLHEYAVEEKALRFGVSDDLDDSSWLIWESQLDRIEPLPAGSPDPGLWLHFACEDDFAVTPWSGGTTTQFLIFPREADYARRNFLWRVSSAAVEDRGKTGDGSPSSRQKTENRPLSLGLSGVSSPWAREKWGKDQGSLYTHRWSSRTAGSRPMDPCCGLHRPVFVPFPHVLRSPGNRTSL